MEFIKTSMRILLWQRNVMSKQIMNKLCTIKVARESLSEQKLSSQSILDNQQKNETLLNMTETLSPLFETDNPSENLFLNIRNEMTNKHLIPEKSVDLKILEACIKNNKFEAAKSYFEYLKSKNYPISNFILLKYLHVLNSGELPISNSIEEDIINICNKIQKDYECLPSSILLTCVHALCMTSKWEMTFDLIKVNGTIEDVTPATLSHIAMAAFKNGKTKIGFEFLEQLAINNNIHGRITIYNIYLDYYLLNEKKELNNAIHKIFHFWKKHDVVPITSVINRFVDVCKEAGWEGHYVRISNNGQCSHCQNYLSSITLQSNFNKLSKTIINDIIIGDDIFQKTSPKELNNFKSFIRKFKPFDIVIDGLNVTLGKTQILDLLITKFTVEGKKVLIITRQHQYKSNKWIFNQDNFYVYFLKNNTQDDPFILYATLSSGNNSKFVSIDQMRQHHHKLKKFNLQKEFIRWQFSHQYTWYFDNVTKKLIVVEPILYNSFAQVKNGHWHIPYKDSMKALHKPAETWACLHCPNE
ncbi:PREDICTED: mitochondrial ribonuclease P protein 3 [Polistes canadensis]|uniref:mitochondrial ribonuclease P protein 3 n=1 Tax=Polistes canadensis TaxID=91411 RepID=UPI000718CC6B|nr:PREDICTED: mitochondrial ribonuclease P protein 3 [Polistes canadensis]